jgi:hypothetical protein
MYKKILFLDGNKSFLKTRGEILPYMGLGSRSCGYSGSGKASNIDNYLLNLIGGVGRMSVKPKTKSKSKSKSGGALKFIR